MQTDRVGESGKRVEAAQRLVRETEGLLHHVQAQKDRRILGSTQREGGR